MNVEYMVSLMKTLGVGEANNDKESKEIALKYLNLANDELYSKTAALNDDLYIKNTITSIPGQTSVTLSTDPFIISKVWMPGHRSYLEGISVDEFDDYEMQYPSPGEPAVYNNIKRIINFYPISSNIPYTFNIRFKPEKTELYLNTQESAIPYPVSFHYVLVNGALYYLFQDESGFKNILKENEAKTKWESGTQNLISYLYGKSKQRNSMYERI